MNKSRVVLVALACIAVPNAGMAEPYKIPDPDSANWLDYCAEFGVETAKYAADHVLYDYNTIDIPQSIWRLDIGGYSVPIPAVNFSDYSVSKGDYGVVVRLRSENGVSLSFQLERASAYKDIVFRSFTEQPHTDTSHVSNAANEARTSMMFGGPVTLTTILSKSFEVTPGSLLCTEASKWQDLKTMVLLENKLRAVFFHGSQGDRVAPFHSKKLTGYVSEGVTRDGQRKMWAANLEDSENEILWTASMPRSMSGAYTNLPYSFTDDAIADDAPGWLPALENAIDAYISSGKSEKLFGKINGL